MVTKSQQLMIDDGLPAAAVISQEERKAVWAANPPRQPERWQPRNHKERQVNLEHPNFPAMDIDALKEAYAQLTSEASDLGLPIESLPDTIPTTELIKFCEDLYLLILEKRGGEKPVKYDGTDISALEPAANQKLAKKKKQPKKAAEAPTKKAAKKTTKAPTKKEPSPKTTTAKKDQLPITAALGLRSGSKHEQIAIFLEAKLGKMVKEKDIVKHIYGDPEVKTNRIKDLMKVMRKDKYELRKEEKNGAVSYGLYAKNK